MNSSSFSSKSNCSKQEQFDFEENEELFNFYREAFDNLIDKYKTIDYTKPKITRGNKSWQAVRAKGES